MPAGNRITDAIDLLSRARLKLEAAAESVEAGQGDKALADVRAVLADVRGEFRHRTENLQALVIAATADTPIPLFLFSGLWCHKNTYVAWCREGMPHCYIEGKLCAKPSVFFAEVAKRARATTDRGRFRRKAGDKGEEPAGVTRNPPTIPVPVASAGDAPRAIQIPTGRKRPAPTPTTTP